MISLWGGVVVTVILALSFSQYLKQPFYKTVSIAVMGIGVVLYIFGLVWSLKAGYYVILTFAMGYAFYLLWSHEKSTRNFEKFQIAMFVMFVIILFISNRNLGLYEYDALAFWAPFVKYNIAADRIFVFFDKFEFAMCNYPPLMSLVQYFYVGGTGGGYNDEVLYSAVNIFNVALLFPLIGKGLENVHLKLKIVSVVCAVTGSVVLLCIFCVGSIPFHTLYVDLSCGILFAFFLITILDEDGKEDRRYRLWALSLAGMSMVLLRPDGYVYAGICLVLYIIANKKRYLDICIICIPASVAFIIQKILTKDIPSNEAILVRMTFPFLKSLVTGSLSDENKEYVRLFWKTFCYSSEEHYLINGISIAIWFILFILLGVIIYRFSKKRKSILLKIYVIYSLGFVGFSVMQMLVQCLRFLPGMGLLASFTRYFGTFLLGGGIFFFYYYLHYMDKKISIILLLGMLFSVCVNDNTKSCLNGVFNDASIRTLMNQHINPIEGIERYCDTIPKEAKIGLVSGEEGSRIFLYSMYKLLPREMRHVSIEELENNKIMDEYDYICLVNGNNYEMDSGLFWQGQRSREQVSCYQVIQHDDGNLYLELIDD